MKLDLLVIAAHPDDAELCCAGTIAALTKSGRKVGVLDLTRGEMGTRGTPELRIREAGKAAEILGLSARVNAGLPDCGLDNTPAHREAIIRCVRHFRPEICLINAPDDRHPDHRNAARLSLDALFYSGLNKLETAEPSQDDGDMDDGYLINGNMSGVDMGNRATDDTSHGPLSGKVQSRDEAAPLEQKAGEHKHLPGDTMPKESIPAGKTKSRLQKPWRPRHILHFMQHWPFAPTFVFDISETMDVKEKAIKAFTSQFDADNNRKEPQTYVSSRRFFESQRARAREYGQQIGVTYGEPYLYYGGPVPLSGFDVFFQTKPER